MQKILNKRERIILYATIAVAVFALVFNFLLAPVMTKNGNLNKEIEVARTKLKKYLRLINKKGEIENRYNKFSAQAQESNAREDSLVSALSELESLARSANIRIVDIRPQIPQSLALYKELIIDLRVEGEMEAYLKFIYNLENSLSLLRIKKFQFNAKSNSPLLEGTFSVSRLSLN